MANKNDNIKNFSNNHFNNDKEKVPVRIFVMQIHDNEVEKNEKK